MNGDTIRGLFATVIGLVLITSSCTAAPSVNPPPPAAPPPSNQAGPLPADCADRITEPEQARAAVAQVRPGSMLCLAGGGLTDVELEVTTSGTPQQPITIVADGATMRGMTVKADYVVIQGLTLRDGSGLTMTGRGLVARNNVIYNATANGLECEGCVDTLLESNTVQRADGTGIWFSGERVTVRNNTVSESVLRTLNDADGIRFFGNGHRLTGNTIKDIKASGYPDGGPHTDCFQTYDSADTPATYDVVIANNVCRNVDVQCLIATIDDPRARRAPAGRMTILFEGNTCEVNGAQAVNLRNFPDVVVRRNSFSGPGDRAVQLSGESTGVAVIGNTMTGRMRPFEVDRQSQQGFQESGNSSRGTEGSATEPQTDRPDEQGQRPGQSGDHHHGPDDHGH
ncbi:MAG: right-handed parallel beta-helix repeat-containing protein [Actinomycetota bacterium]|nr:right-handed parallel beta-helix repeat-containing protein [Actinomycetota bacterium]